MLLHVSDDSNMIFGIRFKSYEQIDEFQPAGQVVAEAKTSDPDRPNRFRIFKKDFQLPLQKRTWIQINVFNNRKFSLDRELWHEYEVPLTHKNRPVHHRAVLVDQRELGQLVSGRQ